MPAARRPVLVALDLPPGEDFAAALTAAWHRGDAVLPLDPQAPQAVRDQVSAALGAGRPIGEGIALVIATSGSTGEPKGVELTHEALQASARATMARLGQADGDRWLSCLPWHHIGGLQVLLRARLFGTPLTVHEKFDVRRIAGERDATLVSLVPTQLQRLLDAGVDLTHFRAVLLGGAAASDALLERARAARVAVVTTYGMSETCGGCVYAGRPLDGVDVRVEADGRICLRGAMLMAGYRGRPELTATALVDGWLRTSDLGVLHSDGTLTVSGRVDDVVVTGGDNVVAAQVAAVLGAHPAIHDVAVTGVPDEQWGQRVVAVIVANDAPPSLEEIRAWCADRMAAAAIPRGMVTVDAIPRLSSGKPDRLAVAALAARDDGVRA